MDSRRYTHPLILTNIFFLLPIFASLREKEWIYFALSISIGITSTAFHILEISESIHFSKMRLFDRVLSIICYLYMIYFASVFLTGYSQILAYTLLLFSIILYLMSKREKILSKERMLHIYFHFVIASVAATIVLLS